MSRSETVRAERVTFIPTAIEPGVLYVSQKYKTATHLCCCGCGEKVVTPLKAGGWQLSSKRGMVSLYPSIGNWSLPCKSHYWIRSNKIVWAAQWTPEQIDAGRAYDQLTRERAFDTPAGKGVSLWERILRLFKL